MCVEGHLNTWLQMKHNRSSVQTIRTCQFKADTCLCYQLSWHILLFIRFQLRSQSQILGIVLAVFFFLIFELNFIGRIAVLRFCILSTLNYIFSLFQHAIKAVSRGVRPVGETNSSYWDMGSSFFFAGTVITTIGNNFTFIL